MPRPRRNAPTRAFDALGNPTRRSIVRILGAGPRSVQEIADELPVSRPAVSKHLRLLSDAKLVAHHADGVRNVFRLERAGFEAARRWLDAFWDDALSRFAMVAENLPEEDA
ncbi:MAG: winged helix-turn-helix transcriptional regulator [Deltaproteobacteria bacterium]|nr:winged helix-turn-helix transcriptional regulator [Deltaproteobacteria bacterium]